MRKKICGMEIDQKLQFLTVYNVYPVYMNVMHLPKLFLSNFKIVTLNVCLCRNGGMRGATAPQCYAWGHYPQKIFSTNYSRNPFTCVQSRLHDVHVVIKHTYIALPKQTPPGQLKSRYQFSQANW